MWRPGSWSELEALLGQAEESPSLDFKRQLAGENAELAKDLAAMTVNGGVLVYGVEENRATGLACELRPFALRGVEERLRQVAGSRIAPTPDFGGELLASPADAGVGVVVVVVPPSLSAPHQVDGRYPCRRGTTTGLLAEAEVERLYRQRRDLAQPAPSASELIEEVTAADNGAVPANYEGFGCLVLLVRPAAGHITHPGGAWQERHLKSAMHAAVQRQASRFANISLAHAFNALSDWRATGSMGWEGGLREQQQPGRSYVPDRDFGATLTYPAQLSFRARWGLNVTDNTGRVLYKSAREPEVARELIAMLAIAGDYYSDTDGASILFAALRIYGFAGAKSAYATREDRRSTFQHLPGAPHGITTSTRVSALELRDMPERTARVLLERWLPSFYQDSPELFALLVPERDGGQASGIET